MIGASAAWLDRQQRFLLPESFLEVNCAITEPGVQEDAVPSGINEAFFSDIEGVLGLRSTTVSPKYATLERNLWALDGSRTILPNDEPYTNVGYVSDISQSGRVTLDLPEVHTQLIPGVTITWSGEFGEYPEVFTVTAKNGDTVVAETTVTDNKSPKSVVYLEISNYDSVTVTVHNWHLPDHRTRIDQVFLGHILTFTKSEIISYSHEQTGCVSTGKLPKNSITFSIDNIDGRWNPMNPNGLEKYLSERQKVTVRYGLDIDGMTEWIKAGTFYMSEWSAPSNGLEASFVARDVLEYTLNEQYVGPTAGTCREIVDAALAQADLPIDVAVDLDIALASYTADFTETHNIMKHTISQVLQYCANAAQCVFYQDRNGTLKIVRPKYVDSGYLIGTALSFSHPEISLSKVMRSVVVHYAGNESYTFSVSGSGEDQTVNNTFISTSEQAAEVAEWVAGNLASRKTISGEFRADPRLDVFDVVTVESKYGNVSVIITDVKYTFTGAFRAIYTGNVRV